MIVKVELPRPPALAAPTLTTNVPEVEGVPEIVPVFALNDNPGGKPVAVKLVGLFVAVIWKAN